MRRSAISCNSTMKASVKDYFLLHLLLLFYSVGGICSKLAGRESFLSLRFILFYGGLLVIMLVYAVGWQQIIKRMPLTTAYSNKAVGLLWSTLWGVLLFQEHLTLRMVIGAVIVLCGVVMVVRADE